jgi:hypothetical protein
LVSIGLVFSEEKIFEKGYDGRRTPSDGKSSHGLWPITHLGVIALSSSNFQNFNTFRPLFQKL